MNSPVSTSDRPLQVFISYARKDLAFAERIAAGLESRGLEVKIDTRDLPKLEDWRRELLGFIREADAVVFIISTHSISSPICHWEVEQVAQLSKRVAPIVLERVSNTLVPEAISRINYIFFDGPEEFDAQVGVLSNAIQTDLGWIKEHTRLGEIARRWDERDRSIGLMLRGSELIEAERWLASRPRSAPEPTVFHRSLILESRASTVYRQRMAVAGSAAAAVVGLCLAGLAYWQRGVAVEKTAIAEVNAGVARAERDASFVSQSRFLVGVSGEQLKGDDGVAAMLIALEGLPDTDNGIQRPLVTELHGALLAGNFARRELAVLSGHVQPVRAVDFSPDGSRLITASWDVWQVWDVKTGSLISTLKGHDLIAGPADFVDAFTRQRVIDLRAARNRVRDNAFIDTQGRTAALSEGYDPTAVVAKFSPDGTLIATNTPQFEAVIWNAKTGDRVHTLRGHARLIRRVAFNRDGALLATASDDATAKLWNTQTGALVATLTGHGDDVTSIAFNPAGTLLATGSEDGTVRIWSAIDGKEQTVFSDAVDEPANSATARAVVSVAFHPDGAHVVTAYADKIARIWSLRDRTSLALKGHEQNLTAASYSPDGARVLTASWDNTCRIFDATTGAQLLVLSGHTSQVEVALFNQAGTRVLTASRDKTARLWHAETGASIARLTGNEGEIWAAAFNADSTRVVTGSDDGSARIWETADGAQVAVLNGHRYGANVSFSPDSTRLVTTESRSTQRRDYRGHPRLWAAPDWKLVADITEPENDIYRAAFNSDSTRFAFGSDRLALVDAKSGAILSNRMASGGYVHRIIFSSDGKRLLKITNTHAALFDGQSGALIRVLAENEPWTLDGHFDPKGRWLIIASASDAARIFDAQSGTGIAELKGHGTGVVQASFNPSGETIVTVSKAGSVRVWSWNGREATLESTLPTNGRVVSMSFSPDGARLLTTTEGNVAELWQRTTGTLIATIADPSDDQLAASFSPNGRRIATWKVRRNRRPGTDPIARLWDAETGASISELLGHTGWVNGVSFSVDGSWLSTSSADGTVRVWSSDSGIPLLVLKGHSFSVQDAAFSPDGRWIATGGVEDETHEANAMVWPVFMTSTDAVRFAKSVVPRCLKPEQRLRYFLPPEPPDWCIEHAKWPYRNADWKQWLEAKRRGNRTKMPEIK